jgi:hypothetical protein
MTIIMPGCPVVIVYSTDNLESWDLSQIYYMRHWYSKLGSDGGTSTSQVLESTSLSLHQAQKTGQQNIPMRSFQIMQT